MKKIFLVMAALAIAATACNKVEEPNTASPYSHVKVHLTVTAPDAQLTKANYSIKDADDPLSGFNVTWKQGDRFTLIVFQGDNASWSSNYIYQDVSLTAEAEGLTSYDLSSCMSPLDLSSFDDTKNLKYVVVYANYGINQYWHEFTYWNGIPSNPYNYTPSQQINNYMFAETDVQEVAFPTGDLTLSGKLHWMTSVLAIQYSIDPAADITYPSSAYLICDLYTDPTLQVNCYYPVIKQSADFAHEISLPIQFSTAAKLSEALDANNCRYYVIPSDNILDADGNPRSLRGASLTFRQDTPTKSFTTVGTLSDVPIEAGKVYGIRVLVTDTDSNGEPEFTKY